MNNDFGNQNNDFGNTEQYNGGINNNYAVAGSDFGQDDNYNYNDDYTYKDNNKTKTIIIIVLVAIVLLIIILLLLKGCSGKSSGLTGVESDIPTPLYMGENGKIRLSAIGDGNLDSTKYNLEIDDEDIAELEDESLTGSKVKTDIEPLKDGKTTLTIDASLDDKKIDTIEKDIVVCKAFNEKALKTPKNISMKPNGTLMVVFELGNESECYSNLEYKVANDNIISIDDNGMITANKTGSTKLSISNGDNTIDLNVKVNAAAKPTPSVVPSTNPTTGASNPKISSITMKSNNKTSSAYAKSGDTITITAKFNQNLSGKPVIIIGGKAASVANGSNTFTASVKVDNSFSNGKVNFVVYNYKNSSGLYGNQGTKVTSGSTVTIDNSKPTCTLSKSGAKLTISGKDNSAIAGYAINQTPASATSYGSTKTKNATATGKWYGHIKDKAGNVGHCNTSVSASDINGGSTTPSKVSVTGVSISANTTSIQVGNQAYLTANITPTNASNKAVTWSSNNTSVATVSSSGVVTGKSAGTATITVKTNDQGKTDKKVITVTATTSADTTKPTCQTTWTKQDPDGTKYTPGNWTSYNVSLTVSCFDTSGISYIKVGGTSLPLKVSGQGQTTASKTFTTEMNKSYAIEASDKKGNVRAVGTYTVKIDKSSPTIVWNACRVDSGHTRIYVTCKDSYGAINQAETFIQIQDSTSVNTINRGTGVANGITISQAHGFKAQCKDYAGHYSTGTKSYVDPEKSTVTTKCPSY